MDTIRRCVCALGESNRRCMNRAAPGSTKCRAHATGRCRIPSSYEDTTAPISGALDLQSSDATLPPDQMSELPPKVRKTEQTAPSWGILKWPMPDALDGISVLYLPERYRIIGTIGSGTFGTVLKVVDEKGGLYALKLDKNSVDAGSCYEPKMMNIAREFVSEIPKVEKCSYFSNRAGKRFTYVVMELFDGDCRGEIRDIEESLRPARNNKQAITVAAAELAYIFREMARQVWVLETHGIFHIDIKFRNMVYKKYSVEDVSHARIRIALTDFGLACQNTPESVCLSTGTIIPPEWNTRKRRQVSDVSEIKLAQRYMVGTSIYDTLTGSFVREDVTRPSVVSQGSILDIFRNPKTAPSAAIAQLYSNLFEISKGMSQVEPTDRIKYHYTEVVEFCNQIIREAAALDGTVRTRIFLNSI